MNFFKFFSSSDKQKSYEKYGEVLKKRVTTKEQRLEAIEALEKVSPVYAIPQLLKRFEMVTDSGLQDNREKERCMDIIVKHKEHAKDFIKEFIRTQRRISWPVKIAEKIFSKDEYIELLLNSLNSDSAIFDEDTLERNAEILLALKDIKDLKIVDKACEFLSNRDEHVRMSALECLEEQATEFDRAKQVIIDLFKTPITDDNSRFLGVVHSIVNKHNWV